MVKIYFIFLDRIFLALQIHKKIPSKSDDLVKNRIPPSRLGGKGGDEGEGAK